MKTHHVCYEGTLACSGCNPCPHCHDVVNREVLAQAMRRTTETIAQARGPKGVVAVEELDTRNFWAVFYSFYVEAWRNLHVAMMTDPKVAERAYDLRGIPGFESTGRYVPPGIAAPAVPVVMPSPAMMPLSALAVQAPSPFMTLDSAPGGDAGNAGAPWAAPFVLREEAPATAAPVTVATPSDVDVEPKLVATPADIRREITADDIVASATVLDVAAPTPPPSANGLATHSNERPL